MRGKHVVSVNENRGNVAHLALRHVMSEHRTEYTDYSRVVDVDLDVKYRQRYQSTLQRRSKTETECNMIRKFGSA